MKKYILENRKFVPMDEIYSEIYYLCSPFFGQRPQIEAKASLA